MSVHNIFHLKCILMTIHNGNVISIKCSNITLLMKERNKMPGLWISVSCFGSTPLKLFVGLRLQASKETARKLKFNKLLSLRWCLGGFLLRPSVIGKG